MSTAEIDEQKPQVRTLEDRYTELAKGISTAMVGFVRPRLASGASDIGVSIEPEKNKDMFSIGTFYKTPDSSKSDVGACIFTEAIDDLLYQSGLEGEADNDVEIKDSAALLIAGSMVGSYIVGIQVALERRGTVVPDFIEDFLTCSKGLSARLDEHTWSDKTMPVTLSAKFRELYDLDRDVLMQLNMQRLGAGIVRIANEKNRANGMYDPALEKFMKCLEFQLRSDIKQGVEPGEIERGLINLYRPFDDPVEYYYETILKRRGLGLSLPVPRDGIINLRDRYQAHNTPKIPDEYFS